MVFKIPESLDYMSLLRPPGPDDYERLDASDADDPESWTSEDVETALGVVKATISRTPHDCLDLLTKDAFNSAFNLMRHFPNLNKTHQMAACQAFSVLCSRTHDILQKIPPNPYFNRNDSAENTQYTDIENKIVECCPSLNSNRGSGLEGLLVTPCDMGLIMRSMCHVCTFLVCTTFKCAMSSPKDSNKSSLSIDLSQSKKTKTAKGGSKKKKPEDGTINHVALELLIDSMLLITKMPINVPFSGEYGGMGYPDRPLLRLLFDTLMLCLSSRIASFVSDKLIDAISRMMSINYNIMKVVSETKVPRAERDGDDISSMPAEQTHEETGSERDPDTSRSIDDEASWNDMAWILSLVDEVKKVHCVTIADAMEVLRDSAIPEVIMNEILISITENFVLQAHGGSAQLMSFAVQTEYTNVGVFIERVTRKLPKVILTNLNRLKHLFDVPSYNLRKSLLESIKLLIILSKNEDAVYEEEGAGAGKAPEHEDVKDYKEAAAKMCAQHREILLQLLLARQYDLYMYARASLLKAFQELIEAEALPIRWYVTVASVALSRLMDKGAQVRQRALNLLTTMIMDTTTKRFKLPMNLEDLKHDLDMINIQLSKLDTIMTIEPRRSSATACSDDLDALSHVGSQSAERNMDPGGIARQTQSVERTPQKVVNKEQLLTELNQDLGENIQLNDQGALLTLRTKLEFAREMYADVYDIAEMVGKSISICKDMLQSSVETDQRASIKYLATCHLMGVNSASVLLPKVWVLSWSNNQNVVDTVLNEFNNVYFANGDDNAIAMRLIKLLSQSHLTDFASIEKIFEVNLGREQPYFSNMGKLMVALLRIAVAPNYQLGRDTIPRVALGVMRLILWSSMRSKSAQAQAIRSFDEKKLSVLRGLLQLSIEQSATIFGEVCLILTKATTSKCLEKTAAYVLKLFTVTLGSMDDGWFRMAQCVVDVTFIHCKFAEVLWTETLVNMMKQLTTGSADKTSLRNLSQIIFLAGHVAIRTIISMDRLQADLKGLRAELESFGGGKGQHDVSSQMGLATSDEQEREVFEQLCEQNIVCDNLLGGPMRNLIVECLHDPMCFITDGVDGEYEWNREHLNERHSMRRECLEKVQREITIVRTCAAVAICKYAAVSKRFCKSLFLRDQPQSKWSVLEFIISLLLNKRLDPEFDAESLPPEKHCYYYLKEPVGATLRSTLLISYGDLLCRHPNLLDPWNSEVFKILLDRNDRVRETAVLVFTHLVMNDMVKPKGKLIDGMMYLTLDAHPKIAESAKTFFHEIHKKNPNTIYNCFPEMIATLARNKRNQSVSRNISILNMLLKFIKKDKHAESIIEKVCMRFQSTEATDKMAIAIYINVLLKVNYDEKCMKKLVTSLPLMTHLIIESETLLAALLLICKRVKSSHQFKKGGEGDKPPENGEHLAEIPDSEIGTTSGVLSETASLKDMAEELIGKLHALFGEGKSTRVSQTSAAAETIIAAIETEPAGEEAETYADKLFINNFGYVSANADQGFSDDEIEISSQVDPPLGAGGFPARIKSEPLEKEGRASVKREHEDNIPQDTTIKESPAQQSKLDGPSYVQKVTSKPAVRHVNEFDSSDDDK